MAERSDFTDAEWFELRSAPWRVAMGVVEVDPSGALTAGREVEAIEAQLAGAQFNEGLIGLVVRDVLDEGRDVEAPPSTEVAATDVEVEDVGLPDRVLDQLSELAPILGKVDAEQAAAFRRWLLDVATAAAEAGREGLAGVTGPKVSEAEAAYLDRLREALGVS